MIGFDEKNRCPEKMAKVDAAEANVCQSIRASVSLIEIIPEERRFRNANDICIFRAITNGRAGCTTMPEETKPTKSPKAQAIEELSVVRIMILGVETIEVRVRN